MAPRNRTAKRKPLVDDNNRAKETTNAKAKEQEKEKESAPEPVKVEPEPVVVKTPEPRTQPSPQPPKATQLHPSVANTFSWDDDKPPVARYAKKTGAPTKTRAFVEDESPVAAERPELYAPWEQNVRVEQDLKKPSRQFDEEDLWNGANSDNPRDWGFGGQPQRKLSPPLQFSSSQRPNSHIPPAAPPITKWEPPVEERPQPPKRDVWHPKDNSDRFGFGDKIGNSNWGAGADYGGGNYYNAGGGGNGDAQDDEAGENLDVLAGMIQGMGASQDLMKLLSPGMTRSSSEPAAPALKGHFHHRPQQQQYQQQYEEQYEEYQQQPYQQQWQPPVVPPPPPYRGSNSTFAGLAPRPSPPPPSHTPLNFGANPHPTHLYTQDRWTPPPPPQNPASAPQSPQARFPPSSPLNNVRHQIWIPGSKSDNRKSTGLADVRGSTHSEQTMKGDLASARRPSQPVTTKTPSPISSQPSSIRSSPFQFSRSNSNSETSVSAQGDPYKENTAEWQNKKVRKDVETWNAGVKRVEDVQDELDGWTPRPKGVAKEGGVQAKLTSAAAELNDLEKRCEALRKEEARLKASVAREKKLLEELKASRSEPGRQMPKRLEDEEAGDDDDDDEEEEGDEADTAVDVEEIEGEDVREQEERWDEEPEVIREVEQPQLEPEWEDSWKSPNQSPKPDDRWRPDLRLDTKEQKPVEVPKQNSKVVPKFSGNDTLKPNAGPVSVEEMKRRKSEQLQMEFKRRHEELMRRKEYVH